MTGDQYLAGVLRTWKGPVGTAGPGGQVLRELTPVLHAWASSCLAELKLSGSYAKGTSVRGDSDVDIFISLIPTTSGTLAELYESLAKFVGERGYQVRRQNVSVRIAHGNYKVDLVPARQQDRWSGDHSLHVRRRGTWTKTNVDKHIENVRSSGHSEVVVLMKRWRDFHGLAATSFALELATLRALGSQRSTGLEADMIAVLRFISTQIKTAALIDPANTNNNVADDLTAGEKAALSTRAAASLSARTWNEVIQ